MFLNSRFLVCTANLTAILTKKAREPTIKSLTDVVDHGLRICSIRTAVLTLQGLHGNYGNFVVDPIDLGGDGLPGFNCQACNVAQRVFDFLDPQRADYDERFCHVAVTQEQHLVVLHSRGLHCNKSK